MVAMMCKQAYDGAPTGKFLRGEVSKKSDVLVGKSDVSQVR